MASNKLIDSLAVSRVYALALMDAAGKAGAIDAVKADVADLQQLLRLSPRTKQLLLAVTIGSEEKIAMLQKTLSSCLNELTWRTLLAMAKRDRLELVPGLLENFGRILASRRGEVEVEVISAEPLDDAARQRLTADIGSRLGRPVVLVISVNPLLIGGMQIKIGDTLVDGSIRTQLEDMRMRLERQVALNMREAGRRMAVS